MSNMVGQSFAIVSMSLLLSSMSLAESAPVVTAPLDFAAAGMAVLGQAADESTPESTGDFVAESWTFQSYGSVRFGDRGGEMYGAHVGVGYFFADQWSLNFEVIGGAADVAGDQTTGLFEFDLLLRWHFVEKDDWSIYMDGGFGIVQTRVSFPESGTHSNFTPQIGIGVTLDLNEKLKLMLGARYVHLSNARHHGEDQNPGWDGAMVYLGVMVPF